MFVFITILSDYNILKHWPIFIQFDKIRDVVGELDINHAGFWIGFSEREKLRLQGLIFKVLKIHVHNCAAFRHINYNASNKFFLIGISYTVSL